MRLSSSAHLRPRNRPRPKGSHRWRRLRHWRRCRHCRRRHRERRPCPEQDPRWHHLRARTTPHSRPPRRARAQSRRRHLHRHRRHRHRLHQRGRRRGRHRRRHARPLRCSPLRLRLQIRLLSRYPSERGHGHRQHSCSLRGRTGLPTGQLPRECPLRSVHPPHSHHR